MSRLSPILSRMFGFQVTNTQTLPEPSSEPQNCNTVTIHSDAPLFFLPAVPSIQTMTLHKTIMKDNDVVGELCADT
jgi:hypothetical protein